MEGPVKWPTIQVILKYFQLMMALVYMLLGAILLLRSYLPATNLPTVINTLPTGITVPLGITLIAYGIVRGYRGYQRSI